MQPAACHTPCRITRKMSYAPGALLSSSTRTSMPCRPARNTRTARQSLQCFLTLHNERGGVQALPLGDFIIANRSALMRLVAPATCVAGEGPLKYVAYADIYIYIYIYYGRPRGHCDGHEAIVGDLLSNYCESLRPPPDNDRLRYVE